MQRLTARAWFRRRPRGLGRRPIAWQGWLVTLIAVASAIAVLTLLHSSSLVPIAVLILVAYALLAHATAESEGEPGPAIVFLITPLITLFRVPASAGGTEVERAVGVMSLLLLIVPIVIPPVIAAYSVVGERDQGTLDRPRRTETPRVGLEPPRGRVGPTLVQGGSYGTRTSRDLRRGQQ